MGGFIGLIVRLIRAGKQAYARKWSFLGIFLICFFGSVMTLRALDLLPSAPTAADTAEAVTKESSAAAPLSGVELPTRVEIPAIGLSQVIENPTTTNIAALDNELLKGAVRYPTSAKLGETGNVVLFGHSSYLPVVRNQAYKTFNDIQKLAAGDVITVYSSRGAYTYRVRSVAKEDAGSAAIPLAVSGRILTLSTCDSFGKKTDRFVVVADFVGSHAISG